MQCCMVFLSYDNMVKQATLRLRLAGMGLRSTCRTSAPAYWASWADALPEIHQRFPATGHQILHRLTQLQSTPHDQALVGPLCLRSAEEGGRRSESAGWRDRPLWRDLAAGLKPSEFPPDDIFFGEYNHGWQYYSSTPVEIATHAQLLQDLAPQRARRNATSTGKARVHSCMGPFASIWLLV